jgi:hypothetical protein
METAVSVFLEEMLLTAIEIGGLPTRTTDT